MFNRLSLAASLVVTSLIAVAPSHAQTTLKLGHVLTRESHYHFAAEAFAESLKKRTSGRISVQIFPQSQLGGEVQMIQALRVGTQDLVVTSQPAVVNTVKEWQIFDVPYLFDSVDDANAALHSKVGEDLLALTKKFNITGLAWLTVIERDVLSASKPVKDVADLDGFKIRVVQSPGYVAAYKALGTNPVPLPYGQLYLALQQGVVDGAETSPDLAIQDKFVEISKHFVLSRINYSPIVLLMSTAAYQKLSPDDRKAVDAAAADAAAADISEYKRQYQTSLQQLKDRGVSVDEISAADWKAKTKTARDEIVGNTPDGANWLKAIESERERHRSKSN